MFNRRFFVVISLLFFLVITNVISFGFGLYKSATSGTVVYINNLVQTLPEEVKYDFSKKDGKIYIAVIVPEKLIANSNKENLEKAILSKKNDWKYITTINSSNDTLGHTLFIFRVLASDENKKLVNK